MSWRDAYAHPTTPFGQKGPFYDPVIGHRGQDYTVDAHDLVPAYLPCVVEYVGRSTGLGNVVGARSLVEDDIFYGWAHLTGNVAKVGQEIVPDDVSGIGLAAGYDDFHGTLWDGAHIHTTRSNQSAYAAASGLLPLYDPAPVIAAAVASTTTAGTGTETVGGFLMALTEQQQDDLYAKTVASYGVISKGFPVTDGLTLIGIGDGEGRYGSKNARYYALTGPGYWVDLSQAAANGVSTTRGKYVECAYTDWEAFAAAAGHALRKAQAL